MYPTACHSRISAAIRMRSGVTGGSHVVAQIVGIAEDVAGAMEVIRIPADQRQQRQQVRRATASQSCAAADTTARPAPAASGKRDPAQQLGMPARVSVTATVVSLATRRQGGKGHRLPALSADVRIERPQHQGEGGNIQLRHGRLREHRGRQRRKHHRCRSDRERWPRAAPISQSAVKPKAATSSMAVRVPAAE